MTDLEIINKMVKLYESMQIKVLGAVLVEVWKGE